MAGSLRFECPCGAVKQLSNHWVLARRTAEGGVHFSPWDAYEAARSGVMTLCGPGCASKLFSQALQEWHDSVETKHSTLIAYEPFQPVYTAEAKAYEAELVAA